MSHPAFTADEIAESPQTTGGAKSLAPTEEKPLWEIALAGYSRYGPAYPASEEYQFDVVPLPFPIYRGEFLRVGDDKDKPVTTRIFRRDRIKLDLDFGLNLPVDSKDIDIREDMPDLDLLLEAGPELEFQFVESLPGDFFLALQTRVALSFDGLDTTWRGMIYSTEFKYTLPFNDEKTKLNIRLAPEFASNDYMDYFYGVKPEFATANRPAYKASAGYLGTYLRFTIGHEINKKFEIRSGIRGGFYQGAKNSDSPLFTTDNTGEVFFAFLWKFWESKRFASTE
ncbi:MAG: MipA/OmpV family protein [Gammaproteobacteria bacterium]|nr:MipA/OmpV family protein [Gammaproteobacteria bacterium]MCP4832704.1 MipA/OmpV family protein [Gammaproteobacteria bacterium]MCP4928042.1 MipA/OmpV family protein [Gammaproteobacteria bacterium]